MMSYRPSQKRRVTVRFVFVCAGMVLLLAASLRFLILPATGVLGAAPQDIAPPNWVDQQLIDIDGAARRGEKLEGIRNIVIHYVANPGTTAQQNRNYFNNPDTRSSSHFVVGLKGEVIQCIPLDEKSSATNERNIDTISIEVCHPDASGKFNSRSYASAVRLTAWLCSVYHLNETDVIRHYDVTGKLCPLYYVEHEDAWREFKSDVKEALRRSDF